MDFHEYLDQFDPDEAMSLRCWQPQEHDLHKVALNNSVGMIIQMCGYYNTLSCPTYWLARYSNSLSR